ncbi:MAG: pyridoxal phosphate-dependent aminotransferase [Pirellulales bacterium]|nr:pyridoxal phosphate-dependent aminotransferase [Pirellulales bacterium]
MTPKDWLANRTNCIDVSGIRRVFELGAKLKNPINLSIGQPDFDVAEETRLAAIEAIKAGKNGYSITQGIDPLREKLQARVDEQYGHADRELFVTSGTSGGLMLATLVLIDPGDEVIVFDPFFIMYEALAGVAGAKIVRIDTYPDFQVDLNRVEAAITPRTKMIIFNNPCNPTGAVARPEIVSGLAELASRHNVLLLSDEIYRDFCYDSDFISPAIFNENTLVVDGLSKNAGMPGWRIGYAHGPKAIIAEMKKLQQYSFVCAPHPLQWAAVAALDVDMSAHFDSYRLKRDLLVEGLADCYELTVPGGAFYAFPKTPWGTGNEFVEKAITEHELLIIPGGVFSDRDTHFRISFAASDEVILRGIEVLRKMADQ